MAHGGMGDSMALIEPTTDKMCGATRLASAVQLDQPFRLGTPNWTRELGRRAMGTASRCWLTKRVPFCHNLAKVKGVRRG
jgi:hypothetical protein